jgi:ribonuclease R
MGQRVHVLLDRIDRQQRRLQFALLPSAEEVESAPRSLRRAKKFSTTTAARASEERPHSSPKRSGKKGKTKSKARERNKKSKSKRR